MKRKWWESGWNRGIYKSLKAKERGGGLKKSLAISEVVRGRRGTPWDGGGNVESKGKKTGLGEDAQ